MLLYIGLFSLILLILSVSSYLENQKDRYLLIGSTFIILWLVASVRFEVGTDYKNYWNYFVSESSVNDGFEPFYVGFHAILHFFNLSPLVFFSFASLVTLAFFYLSALKYSDKTELVILLFILTGLYTNSFNIVRHYIALSIVLYFGYGAMVRQNFLHYFIAIIAASFFHMSALIMVPFYFLFKMNWGNYTIAAFLLLAFLFNIGLLGVTAVNIPGLPEKYAGYLQFMDLYLRQNDEPIYLKFLNNVDKLVILFLLVKYKEKLVALKSTNLYLINIYAFFCAFTLATRGLEEIQRMGYYFYIFSPFAIVLLSYIPKDKLLRAFTPAIIVGVYFLYFIFIILMKNYGEIIPFRTF